MTELATIVALASHLRQELENKKYLLLFAYNGTGKTRLSMEFKNIERKIIRADEYARLPDPKPPIVDEFHETSSSGEEIELVKLAGDTLYFNAFTEDLFSWDNDLDSDSKRVLKLNDKSRFFMGLKELEMDTRIRPLLSRYADFDFLIDPDKWEVSFSRRVPNEKFDENDGKSKEEREKIESNIKISRGEENIFIWCFFLAIAQLAIDSAPAYSWVKCIYVDDPISSLDEHNAIAVANHLAQLLKQDGNSLKTVISTHHPLFFNVLCNELGRAKKYLLSKGSTVGSYILHDTGETPFFHHVATLVELHEAEKTGKIYTHHFNTLRQILEKTASFHGLKGFSDCIKQNESDTDGVLYTRLINILSHGNYSLYEPQELLDENKEYFRQILRDFLSKYPFNPELFATSEEGNKTA